MICFRIFTPHQAMATTPSSGFYPIMFLFLILPCYFWSWPITGLLRGRLKFFCLYQWLPLQTRLCCNFQWLLLWRVKERRQHKQSFRRGCYSRKCSLISWVKHTWNLNEPGWLRPRRPQPSPLPPSCYWVRCGRGRETPLRFRDDEKCVPLKSLGSWRHICDS